MDLETLVAQLEQQIPLEQLPTFAKPAQMAEVMQVTIDSLAHDRMRGRGLPYVKHGPRVRYPRAAVLRYLAERSALTEPAV